MREKNTRRKITIAKQKKREKAKKEEPTAP